MPKNIEIKDILQKVSLYCSRGEKCKFDIKKYLKNYDLNIKQIEDIINTLTSENFINEERYTTAFVNDKFKFNKWGKIKIINELKARSIDSKIIYEIINKIDEKEYLLTLKQLLDNKQKQIKSKDPHQQKAALIRFGLSRGFDYNNILKYVDKIIIDEDF